MGQGKTKSPSSPGGAKDLVIRRAGYIPEYGKYAQPMQPAFQPSQFIIHNFPFNLPFTPLSSRRNIVAAFWRF
jgi:hypothetical protein